MESPTVGDERTVMEPTAETIVREHPELLDRETALILAYILQRRDRLQGPDSAEPKVKLTKGQRFEMSGYRLMSPDVIRTIVRVAAYTASDWAETAGKPFQRTRKGLSPTVGAGYGVDPMECVTATLSGIARWIGKDHASGIPESVLWAETLATVPKVAYGKAAGIADRLCRDKLKGKQRALPIGDSAEMERVQGSPNYAMQLDQYGNRAQSAGIGHGYGSAPIGVPELHAPSMNRDSLQSRLQRAGIDEETIGLCVSAMHATERCQSVSAAGNVRVRVDTKGRAKYRTPWAIVPATVGPATVQRKVKAAMTALLEYERTHRPTD